MKESLDALLASIWIELGKAAGDKAHGWRVPVLATRHGDDADARTVVLREVNAAARELLIYTDARSPKAAQLRAHPRGVLVAWCPRLNWQLRITAGFAVETDGLEVSSRWARLQLHPSSQDYMSPLPPGSVLPPAQAPQPDRDSRGHFALLRARVTAIDWTGLRASGHRRAVFDAQGGRWVSP